MANVLITGGAGFLGSRLARALLTAGALEVAGGEARPLDRLTLVDRVTAPPDLAADARVTAIEGDLADLLAPDRGGPASLGGADVIFHLAAAVSAECEADFDLGVRANLRATEALLAAYRSLGTSPVVVFASSLAAFGDSRDHPLPEVVDDQTLPNPQTSYGVQKVIGEQLLADYTRKGFLRGRTVRLMTVCVRPGRPNAAASGFMSSIIREPLAGERAVCPVGPKTAVALASPASDHPGAAARRRRRRRNLGRPQRGQPARAHRDRRGHGRRAGAGRRARSGRADRLGTGPGGGADRERLARPAPHGPGGPAGPESGPGLRLDHRDAHRRNPRLMVVWAGTPG